MIVRDYNLYIDNPLLTVGRFQERGPICFDKNISNNLLVIYSPLLDNHCGGNWLHPGLLSASTRLLRHSPTICHHRSGASALVLALVGLSTNPDSLLMDSLKAVRWVVTNT